MFLERKYLLGLLSTVFSLVEPKVRMRYNLENYFDEEVKVCKKLYMFLLIQE